MPECYICGMPIMEDKPTRTNPARGMRHAKPQDCIDMLKAANRVLIEGGTMLLKKNERLVAENEKLHTKNTRLRSVFGRPKTNNEDTHA